MDFDELADVDVGVNFGGVQARPWLPHGARPHWRAFPPEFLTESELMFRGSVSGRNCSAGDDERHDARADSLCL